MNYRLKNKHNQTLSLCLTAESWFKILRMADHFGWVPVGNHLFDVHEAPASAGTHLGVPIRIDLDEDKLSGGLRKEVVLEDALSLAEALERAFLEYEAIRLPIIYYLFGDPVLEAKLPPSIGVITELIRFCQSGSFWVEEY